MAKTAAQRRAARKRNEQERIRRRAEPAAPRQAPDEPSEQGQGWPGTSRELLVRALVSDALAAAYAEDLDRIATALAVADPEVDVEQHVTGLLLTLLASLWEHGWQPADVAHLVRREGRVRMTRLGLAAIARQAQVSDAAARAPEEWLAQLSALDTAAEQAPAVIRWWCTAERLPAREAWREVLQLITLLDQRGELPQLLPPPSRWSRREQRRAAAGHTADPRMLGRIRGLLAKAESTEFPEEAEALSAKAQELMTRYAVDEAVLDAERGDSLTDQVEARRVHLENPYPEAKLRLLDAVGAANGVRVIYTSSLAIATTVGLPVDLDLVDLLFTSLLVQATRAMAAAGRSGDRGTRAPSFRRAFLMAYATRIRERLAEVRDHATEEAAVDRGAALVPVLRARQEAVDDVFDRLFPQTYALQSRAWNARGWHAGRLAAETADLGSGRRQLRD